MEASNAPGASSPHITVERREGGYTDRARSSPAGTAHLFTYPNARPVTRTGTVTFGRKKYLALERKPG